MSPSLVQVVQGSGPAYAMEFWVIVAAVLLATGVGLATWWMLRRLFDPIDRR